MTQTTQTLKFGGKVFKMFPEPVVTFTCEKGTIAFWNKSIKFLNANSGSEINLKIFGVDENAKEITSKTIVAFADFKTNQPVAAAPLSKFEHAEILAECLQKIL